MQLPTHSLNTSLLLTAAAATLVGIWLWRQKKKRTYVKVGRVQKLWYFPVKSMKAVETTSGTVTKLGFVVNEYLDRSFTAVDKDCVLVSQRQAPRLALLYAKVSDGYIIISGPDVEDLKVEIKNCISINDTVKDCRIHADSVKAVDCGDVAAHWLQKFLDMPDVRLMQFVPGMPDRKYVMNEPFYEKSMRENPVALQDLAAIHLLSQPSLDDLNTRIENNSVSVFNFRPNVLVEGCQPYAEDSWKFMKFSSGAEIAIIIPTSRCLMTTNNPETGELTNKEPLVTLRKYRVPKDPKLAKIVHHIPCLGVSCRVIKEGGINVGDDVYAIVEDF